MIISHRYGLIFIHCRKVAGGSIQAALGPILAEEDVITGGVHECLRKGGALTRPARFALAHPRSWLGMGRAELQRRPLDEIVNSGAKARYYGWPSRTPDHPTAEEARSRFRNEWERCCTFCSVRRKVGAYQRDLASYHGPREREPVGRLYAQEIEASGYSFPAFPDTMKGP